MLRSVCTSTRLRSLIVNSFTSFNLVLGVLSLIAATAGLIRFAAWGLLCCVVLDMCDGSLARRWDVSSDFGAQLDSLADMTSFIIAGATLIYYWVQPMTPLWLIILASSLYALSGAFRLARFNTTTTTQPGYFQGMPTTFVAAAVATNYLVAPALNSYWVVALVTLLAVLMVSLFPYPKFSPAMLRRCPPWLMLALVGSAVVNISWTVWLVTAAYISTGPAIWLRRRHLAAR